MGLSYRVHITYISKIIKLKLSIIVMYANDDSPNLNDISIGRSG